MQQLQQTILLYLKTLTCTVAVIIGENESVAWEVCATRRL